MAQSVIAGNAARAETFLDYSVLAEDPVKGQQLGILIIEAGVGITVTGVLLSVSFMRLRREGA